MSFDTRWSSREKGIENDGRSWKGISLVSMPSGDDGC